MVVRRGGVGWKSKEWGEWSGVGTARGTWAREVRRSGGSASTRAGQRVYLPRAAATGLLAASELPLAPPA